MPKGPKKLYNVTFAIEHNLEVEARSEEEAEALALDKMNRLVGQPISDLFDDAEVVFTSEMEDVTDEYDGEDALPEEDFDPAESAVRVLGEIIEENEETMAKLTALASGTLN